MDRPDWTYWLNRTLVEVKDACALSCDVSPEAFDKINGRFVPTREAEAYREITRRIELANDAIRAGNLETRHARGPYYEREVALSEFRRWGESLPFPATFPAEFPAATPKPDAAAIAATPEPVTGELTGGKELSAKRENTLLRVIVALAKTSKIDISEGKSGASLIAAAIRDAKFDGPDERAIRDILKKARAL